MWKHATQHCLAGTYLTDNFRDAFTVLNGVTKCLQNDTSIASLEKKMRIRGNSERWFLQTKVVLVHGKFDRTQTISLILPRYFAETTVLTGGDFEGKTGESPVFMEDKFNLNNINQQARIST